MKRFVLILLLTVSGCAAGQKQMAYENGGGGPLDCLAIGDALAHRGRHLEASFFYEAALAGSGDEKGILPKLIRAQIRGERLRAARQNASRLAELVGETEPLQRLIALLDTYAPQADGYDGGAP